MLKYEPVPNNIGRMMSKVVLAIQEKQEDYESSMELDLFHYLQMQ